MKTKVVLQLASGLDNTYRVVALDNRLEPRVGSILQREEVEKLLLEARNLRGRMSVQVKN